MKQAISVEQFKEKNHNVIFRDGAKQILIIGIEEKIFAIDNRCPHEGFPLSKGSTNDSCILTCNWHNWKFDLQTGRSIVGGDNVRTYNTEIIDDYIWVDTSDPSKEEIQASIIEGLQVGFQKRQYGRVTREITRLIFNDIDPLITIKKAIEWSYNHFEFGMTHAYAACADWLLLYQNIDPDDEAQEKRIICLTEAIDHIAHNALRHPLYTFPEGILPYQKEDFQKAVEAEDHEQAFALLNGAIQEGLGVKELEETLAEIALAHYNDFGHSLIYVQKVSFLSQFFDDPQLDVQLLKALTRSLLYATREDLLPEFSTYSSAFQSISTAPFGTQTTEPPPLKRQRVTKALNWVVSHAPEYSAQTLYQTLLLGNAQHMSQFDTSYQDAYDNPVHQNVGWLDFTHAITFSNAVHFFAKRYPKLWKQGLLQMACFYGRNSPFIDPDIQPETYDITDIASWKEETLLKLFDHGINEPIVSAHVIKTTVAALEEGDFLSESAQNILYRSLNRFLQAPLKRRHARRITRQAIKLVSKDYQ